MLSVPHLVIIFVVALVVFGPQKLPELARTLGKLMADFRRATGDLRSTFDEHMRELDREAQVLAQRKRDLDAREATMRASPMIPPAVQLPEPPPLPIQAPPPVHSDATVRDDSPLPIPDASPVPDTVPRVRATPEVAPQHE